MLPAARVAATQAGSRGAGGRKQRPRIGSFSNILKPHVHGNRDEPLLGVSGSRWGRFHAACVYYSQVVTHSTGWHRLIMVSIFVSCIEPAINTPSEEMYSGGSGWLRGVDLTTTMIFTLECLLLIVAGGVRAYFRSCERIMELVVVLASWLSFSVDLSGASAVKLLRLFRPLQ
jgi:hypothetical protein